MGGATQIFQDTEWAGKATFPGKHYRVKEKLNSVQAVSQTQKRKQKMWCEITDVKVPCFSYWYWSEAGRDNKEHIKRAVFQSELITLHSLQVGTFILLYFQSVCVSNWLDSIIFLTHTDYYIFCLCTNNMFFCLFLF